MDADDTCTCSLFGGLTCSRLFLLPLLLLCSSSRSLLPRERSETFVVEDEKFHLLERRFSNSFSLKSN